jgi:hypothetical protein
MSSTRNWQMGRVVENELGFEGRATRDTTVMDIDILLTRSVDVLIGNVFYGYVVLLDYKANPVRIESAP